MLLTKMQKDELAHHFWRVSTSDAITQQAITDELARRGDVSDSQSHITHGDKLIPTFIVDFRMVEFLARNKHTVPYSFTAYHRKNRSGGWHVWREGKETAVQKLIKEFPVTAEKLRADALKKKKHANLMKKSALMSRPR